ncbi:hypothetical protein ACFFWD_01110 [Bradyrhizobium erythrophlei]|uniref:hypothetical protein n=1 Tax=Bradyrhizobium erythrophlei TaxID=1437360 RepID=UPI0035EFA2CA
MPRLSLNFLLAFCLAAPGFSAAADDSRTGQPNPAFAADRVGCSLHPKAEKPSDPSSTSAISHAEKFVARDHFKENISSSAAVRISWLGATFARRFAGKIEDDQGDGTFQTYVLNASSSDKEILATLGQGHESNLVDVWCLLRQQANGASGALQTDSKPNIFFVRDIAGELGVVDAIWGGVGWEIGASPVGDRPRWSSGTRVFSR